MVLLNKKNQKKDIDPKYYLLRQIRRNPKKVEIHDLETDKVVLYPFIYIAALALDQNTGVMSMYNRKVWRNRYDIKVLNLNMFIPIRGILRLFL